MKSPRNAPPDLTEAWTWNDGDVPKTLTVATIGKAQLNVHIHAPPACQPTQHPSSCQALGHELSCKRFTNKKFRVDICVCNHLRVP